MIWRRLSLLLLVAICILLGLWVAGLRRRAQTQLTTAAESQPLLIPGEVVTPVTLLLANDTDGSLTQRTARVPLPQESSARARTLVNALLREYTLPGALHPIAPSPGVDTVFLTPLPTPAQGADPNAPQGSLAVVNLSGGFAAVHPSGIEPETLTLLSILGTLHANLPEVAEVRFLVDGQPRPTLAGHADLTRTYLAASSSAPVPQAPAASTDAFSPAPAGDPSPAPQTASSPHSRGRP